MDSTNEYSFDSFKTIKVDTHDNRYHIYADNLIFCLTNKLRVWLNQGHRIILYNL